jgi:hypothetical protein
MNRFVWFAIGFSALVAFLWILTLVQVFTEVQGYMNEPVSTSQRAVDASVLQPAATADQLQPTIKGKDLQ